MEANKIKIKTLFISIATIAFIEVATRIVISRSYFNPMAILGVARVLETGLIILIVLVWGKGLSSIGLAPSTMSRGLKKGLIWSAGFGLVTFFGLQRSYSTITQCQKLMYLLHHYNVHIQP